MHRNSCVIFAWEACGVLWKEPSKKEKQSSRVKGKKGETLLGPV